MTCTTSETQPYTILFQKLADARSAQDEVQREETDRVMQESEEIKTVRELAEAASEQKGVETYTTA
jgi:hypothetical protein